MAGATREWKDVFISHPCSKRQRTFAFILMHNQKNGNMPVHMYVYVLLKYLMDSCLTKTKPHRSCQGKKAPLGLRRFLTNRKDSREPTFVTAPPKVS